MYQLIFFHGTVLSYNKFLLIDTFPFNTNQLKNLAAETDGRLSFSQQWDIHDTTFSIICKLLIPCLLNIKAETKLKYLFNTNCNIINRTGFCYVT